MLAELEARSMIPPQLDKMIRFNRTAADYLEKFEALIGVTMPEADFGLRFRWWGGNSANGARSGAYFGEGGRWSGRGGGLD
jgi:hypothetical protein